MIRARHPEIADEFLHELAEERHRVSQKPKQPGIGSSQWVLNLPLGTL